jgi:hypothetical protein
VGWFFGKKRSAPEPILAQRTPKDEERLGPAPPPPPTAHAPGLSVHAFRSGGAGVSLLAERSPSRPSRTLVFEAGAPPAGLEGDAGVDVAGLALCEALVTTGAGDVSLAAGDVLFAGPGEGLALRGGASGCALLLDVSPAGHAAGRVHVRRDELVGRGFAGVTGIRALHGTASVLAVRLGPPPGARWVLVGLRAFAVFHGKLVVVDRDEAREVRAGEIGVVADPTATLYLSAGNDGALALGFASPELVVALG